MIRILTLSCCLLIVSGCTSVGVDVTLTKDGAAVGVNTSGQTNGSPQTSTVKKGPDQYEVFGKVYTVMDSNIGYLEIGVASWYGKKFHGRLTANGEVYDSTA